MIKFDFAIGNPPYQEETLGDNKGFAPPVYNKFMDAAYTIADHVELIHPARFLFNAGSTPKEWNKKMLSDPHFKVLQFEHDASRVFPSTEIKGGVAITYRDAKKEYGAINTFIPFQELSSIASKVTGSDSFVSLTTTMENQTRFDLDALYADHPKLKKVIGSDGRDKRFRNNIFDKINLFKEKRSNNSDMSVIGVSKNKRQWRYFPSKYVEKPIADKWRVLIARVNGAGVLGEVLSTPIIIPPESGFTQTFISIGQYSTQRDAENALKYVKSKFTRTLLSVLKITQDNSIETWANVPLQDFSEDSDIDWSTSLSEIDQQLYKKYGLSPDEINFIESHVKEME